MATWSSNAPSVASVDEEGRLHGLSIGRAVVTATVDEVPAYVNVDVAPVPVASVVIEPSELQLIVGETRTLGVHALDGEGNELSGRSVTWSSTAPGIAAIAADGSLVAIAPGQARITAAIEGVSADVEVQVVPVPVATVSIDAPAYIAVGQRALLAAVARDGGGSVLPGRTVAWSSSDPGVAAIEADGWLRGVAVGEVQLTATIDGVSASVPMAVRVPVARIEITPAEAELVLGQSLQLTAVLLDAEGNVLADRVPEWSTSHAEFVSVDAWGVARCVDAGSVSIRVAIEGLDTQAEITCTELRFASLAAGGGTICGLSPAGRAYCWGVMPEASSSWQQKTAFPRHLPTPAPFTQLSVGLEHVCGLAAGGVAFCMGNNDYGALGDGSNLSSNAFVPVVGGHQFSEIRAGGLYTCGIDAADGRGWCWGSNLHGELGTGDTVDRNEPAVVSGNLSFSSIAIARTTLGRGSTCGITSGGAAYCWGDNTTGQLGDGTTNGSSVPVLVQGGFQWSDIAMNAQAINAHGTETGAGHACGVTVSGNLYCWGANEAGQLGNGSTTDSSVPVPVSGSGNYSGISVGAVPLGERGFSCALSSTGEPSCWGSDHPYLWSSSYGDQSADHPVPVGTTVLFSLLLTTDKNACGLGTDGLAYCWGRGYEANGQDTTSSAVALPQVVLGQQL